MERAAFDLLHAMERSWWYRSRARALRVALSHAGAMPHTVLDYGCGWGGMYHELASGGTIVDGYEPDEVARTAAAARGYRTVFATDADALARTYDGIALLDVLEHIEDDRGFLVRAAKALAPGGFLAISVPAFQFLWSVHDVEHQHFRRYTVRRLRERLEAAGYQVRSISYWNSVFFLPAVLMRLLGRTGESSLSMPGWLDALFYHLLGVEAWFLDFFRIPAGTGIVAVARRP